MPGPINNDTEIIVGPQFTDNITLNAGSGGETLRSHNIDGLQYQVIKVATGGDGVASVYQSIQHRIYYYRELEQ